MITRWYLRRHKLLVIVVQVEQSVLDLDADLFGQIIEAGEAQSQFGIKLIVERKQMIQTGLKFTEAGVFDVLLQTTNIVRSERY